MDEEIRADDFRRAWPRALSLAIEQASVTIEAAQSMSAEFKATQDKMIELARLTPAMMGQAEQKLLNSTEQLVQVIDRKAAEAQERVQQGVAVGVERLIGAAEMSVASSAQANDSLIAAHTQFLASFREERAALEQARAANEKVLAQIHRAQIELDRNRREFNSKSFFDRLFARA